MVFSSRLVEATEMFIDGEWVPVSAAFTSWTMMQVVERVL